MLFLMPTNNVKALKAMHACTHKTNILNFNTSHMIMIHSSSILMAIPNNHGLASSPLVFFLHPFQKSIYTHTHPSYDPLDFVRDYPSEPVTEPIWILLKQERVSRSGISRAICKSAPRPSQIATPASHHSVFTGWMPFLLPN